MMNNVKDLVEKTDNSGFLQQRAEFLAQIMVSPKSEFLVPKVKIQR